MALPYYRLQKEREKIEDELKKEMHEQLQEAETNYKDKLAQQKTEYESTIRSLRTDLVSDHPGEGVAHSTLNPGSIPSHFVLCLSSNSNRL